MAVGVCLFGAFAAVMAFFYLPLYLGRLPFPVTILGIGWLCWAAPRLVHRLTWSLPAAFAPVLVIFVVTAVLLILPNQLNGLPLRVFRYAQWRVFALLGAISLAGAASLALLWGDAVARRVRGTDATATAGPVDTDG
ncbi:MAG: hypothetical protein ACR2P2_20130 [Nakamurella sp.]